MGKEVILGLLFEAQQVLAHDCKIDGLAMDDAELNNADVEDCFEEIRSALNTVVEKVAYYVD